MIAAACTPSGLRSKQQTTGGVIALALQFSAEMRSLPMSSLACQVVVAKSPSAKLSRIPGCCFIMCERNVFVGEPDLEHERPIIRNFFLPRLYAIRAAFSNFISAAALSMGITTKDKKNSRLRVDLITATLPVNNDNLLHF